MLSVVFTTRCGGEDQSDVTNVYTADNQTIDGIPVRNSLEMPGGSGLTIRSEVRFVYRDEPLPGMVEISLPNGVNGMKIGDELHTEWPLHFNLSDGNPWSPNP